MCTPAASAAPLSQQIAALTTAASRFQEHNREVDAAADDDDTIDEPPRIPQQGRRRLGVSAEGASIGVDYRRLSSSSSIARFSFAVPDENEAANYQASRAAARRLSGH